MRVFLLVLAVIACMAAFSTMSSAHTAATPKLIATVGKNNGFTISLRFTNGKLVKSLKHGHFIIVVHDDSSLHNFALGSVTQNRRIFTGSVPKVGVKNYRVTLTAGIYAYACSAHPTTMHGKFVVR